MNRELKFRAFITGVMKPIAILHNTPHPARVLDMDFDTNHVNATLFPVETPVMQYTGLKDKNGKEIYEGDIVRVTCKGWVKGSEHEVIYKDAGFSLVHAKRHGDEYGVYTRNFPAAGDEYEIIGNIYENPDLLK